MIRARLTLSGTALLLAIGACGGADLPAQVPPPPPMPPPPPVGAPSLCDVAKAEWIWCDDFERDRSGYFEVSNGGGVFVRTPGAGWNGSSGMRVQFRKGQVDAGFLHLAFGRTPQQFFQPVDAGTRDYREIWWRFRLGYEPGWIGGGGVKISRATIFASPAHWGQAMIAHVWSGGTAERDLVLDPASGVDPAGNLVTTTYNDFDHLRWLGSRRVPGLFANLTAGRWFCVEAHVRLNDPGQANGVFDLSIDGVHAVGRTDLDWVGPYTGYGINAVFLENYWNAGAPVQQARVFDDFIVSTAPIGCSP